MDDTAQQLVLQDCSNTEHVQQAQRYKPKVKKTFSRKKKGGAQQQEETLDETLEPRLAVKNSKAASNSPLDSENDAADTRFEGSAAQVKPQRRRAMPTAYQHEAAIRAKHLADLRAHFAEVDAFQLVEESPSPAVSKSKARTQQIPCSPQQHQQSSIRPDASEQVQARPSQLSSNAGTCLIGDRQKISSMSPPGSPAAGYASSAEPGREDAGAQGLFADDAGAAEQRPYSHLLASPGSPVLSPSPEPQAAAGSPHDRDPAPFDSPSPSSSLAVPVSMSTAAVDSPGGKSTLAPRHMALGMSRRASVCIAHPPADTAFQDQPREAEARQSMLNRSSISDRLARLSLGMAGPAQRSNLSSGMSDIALAPRHAAAAADRRATMQPTAAEHCLPPTGVSPIAESPDTAEVQADASASGLVTSSHASSPLAHCSAAEHPETLQMQQLSLGDTAEGAGMQEATPRADTHVTAQSPASTPLEALLHLAGQSEEADALPCMDDLLLRFDSLQHVRKLGEGTFGEAFGTGKVVFKVIPLAGARLVNGEVQKTAEEILAEAAITLELSRMRDPETAEGELRQNVTTGFVELFGLGICQGQYSSVLAREWHAWDGCHNSENDPVDGFDKDQMYIVYITADGGLDLEHLELRSFGEGKSILLQIALTLAVAEEACDFEHRDLHWGNVLIRRCTAHQLPFRLRGIDMEVVSEGVEVVLIDFTLSRLRTPAGNVQFCNLADDVWLFEQPKGDCQADTYRRMRQKTKDHWQGFHPATNALWMHYLAEVMLSHKQLRRTAGETRALRGFRKRALSYGSCSEVVWDDFFIGHWLTSMKQEACYGLTL